MQSVPKFLCPLFALSALLPLHTRARAQTSYFSIQPPGSVFTIPVGENDKGVITGRYQLANGGVLGFVRSPDGTITTPTLPVNSFGGFLAGVNNANIAAGAYLQNFAYHSATYNIATDTWTPIPDIAGTVSGFAIGINNANLVVGIGIGGFDAQGQPTGAHGYFYDGGYTPFDVPGVDTTFAGTIPEDINDAGTVVGFYSPTGKNGLRSGFVRDSSGAYITVDHPGADSTFFEGINNQGVVAGSYDVGGVSSNFTWTAAGGFTDFNVPLGVNAEVWGIDNYGNLVGDYLDPQQGVYVGFGSVPEPGSVAFFTGMSLTGAAFLRRYRRVRKAA